MQPHVPAFEVSLGRQRKGNCNEGSWGRVWLQCVQVCGPSLSPSGWWLRVGALQASRDGHMGAGMGVGRGEQSEQRSQGGHPA